MQRILLAFALLPSLIAIPVAAQAPQATETITRRVAEAHANYAFAIYSESVQEAERLQGAIRKLVANPSAQALADCRKAWIKARKVYGQTEVLRFYGGPIDNRRDGPEPLLNAWPVDEAYIDAVKGRPNAGIIHDTKNFPNLNATLLALANERGGEANVCVGWHAIEFLLWGQDLFEGGPGRRPHTDFVDGGAPHADRRRQFIAALGDLLVAQLIKVRDAWAPEHKNYRRQFLAAPPALASRRILTGLVVLSGFELSGERMAVALETAEQEDEHSCFSDTTTNDMIANQLGIRNVWFGEHPSMQNIGLRSLALEVDLPATVEVDRLVKEGVKAVRALPQPFELALTLDKSSPHRMALKRAVIAIEQQAEALAALGLSLGHEIPMLPGS